MAYEGTVYPETHIADLLCYSLREYGKSPPKGYSDFQNILKRLNIPQGLVQQQKSFLPEKKVDKQHKGWVKL